MGTVFDMRNGNRWGHSIGMQWGNKNPYKIHGWLTPCPKEGDYIVSQKGDIFLFKKVEPMGNPPDGFFADLEFAKVAIEQDEALPSWEGIKAFLKENLK